MLAALTVLTGLTLPALVAPAAVAAGGTAATSDRPLEGRGERVPTSSPTVRGVAVRTVGTASAPQPATPRFGAAIEDYSAYEPGTTCTLVDRPGAKRFARLIRTTYGTDQSIGISYNACYTISEHNEGRAVDWMLDASNPKDVAKAKAMFAWLFATDKYGNTDAMARRLGIMYIIWNHRMWRAYDGGVWGDYSGTNPHTDHIHFSFDLDGATARSSFWTGHPLPGPCETAPLTDPAPSVPIDPMTYVPVPATRVVATSIGKGTVNGPCRLYAPLEYGSVPTRLNARVTGVGDVPATGVSAVLLHVTMRSPNTTSSLRVGPAGVAVPKAARVTAPLNGTASSMVVVPVGADGKVSFTTSAGATALAADVVGYYPAPAVAARATGPAAGERYRPVAARNVLNPTTLLPAGSTRRLAVAGQGAVPADATAVVVNISVGTSPGSGQLFAYPAGADRPRSALLSYLPRHVTTIQTVVPVGRNGGIVVDNAGGQDKPVWVDVVGAYVPDPSPDALGLVARKSVVPVADSRRNVGLTVLNSGDTKLLALGPKVPPQARAVVLSVTVAKPTRDTRLTFWRADEPMPGTVDMSASTGRAVTSSIIVPLSPRQRIKLHNAGADDVNLVVRLAGYLA